MDDKIQLQLIELLDKLNKGIEITSDQIAPTIEQIISYGIFKYSVGLTIFLTITLICTGVIWHLRKKFKNDIEDALGTFIPLFLIGIVSFAFCLKNIFLLVKINIAPNIYILEALQKIN